MKKKLLVEVRAKLRERLGVGRVRDEHLEHVVDAYETAHPPKFPLGP